MPKRGLSSRRSVDSIVEEAGLLSKFITISHDVLLQNTRCICNKFLLWLSVRKRTPQGEPQATTALLSSWVFTHLRPYWETSSHVFSHLPPVFVHIIPLQQPQPPQPPIPPLLYCYVHSNMTPPDEQGLASPSRSGIGHLS